jgi:hypothetical protein
MLQYQSKLGVIIPKISLSRDYSKNFVTRIMHFYSTLLSILARDSQCVKSYLSPLIVTGYATLNSTTLHWLRYISPKSISPNSVDISPSDQHFYKNI